MPARPDLRLVALGAILAAAMLWGTTGTVQALLPAAREPLVVAALRLATGALALVVLAALTRGGWRSFRTLRRARVVAAGLAIGVYNLLFFAAVEEAGVGLATALAIGSAPVWVTAWEVLRGRPPGPARLAAQALCIAGAAILVLSGHQGGAGAFGIVAALVAGSCYAGYSLLTSAMSRDAPAPTLAAATFGVAALVTAPVLAIAPVTWVLADAAWAWLVFLGVAATGLSYALYTWGLGHVAASTAVTLALAEPLTAWLLATLVVGEPATPARLAGAALLFAGLAAVALTPARSSR